VSGLGKGKNVEVVWVFEESELGASVGRLKDELGALSSGELFIWSLALPHVEG
jgi:hypothetical protein